jgi:hypothetical protein
MRKLIGSKVRVYFNLHKRQFSIMQGGKVVAHADSVLISDAHFTVQKAGRDRVIATKKKNVHAFVCGKLRAITANDVNLGWRSTASKELPVISRAQNNKARYNPYDVDHFCLADKRIDTASAVLLEKSLDTGRPNIFVG